MVTNEDSWQNSKQCLRIVQLTNRKGWTVLFLNTTLFQQQGSNRLTRLGKNEFRIGSVTQSLELLFMQTSMCQLRSPPPRPSWSKRENWRRVWPASSSQLRVRNRKWSATFTFWLPHCLQCYCKRSCNKTEGVDGRCTLSLLLCYRLLSWVLAYPARQPSRTAVGSETPAPSRWTASRSPT